MGEPEKARCFLSLVRWQIAILSFFGFSIAFGIRANFGVAKTRMTANFTDAYGVVHEKEFFWTPTEVGMMESSFFYGYAITQIPAGLLATKFAANRLFCFGIFLASVCNISIGFAFHFHPYSDYIVVGLQIVQGMSLGLIFPAMHGVWRYWAPPNERSRLVTTSFIGGYFGIMLGLSGSAALISYAHWSAPFYSFGIAGVIWGVIWTIFTAKCPSEHTFITAEEKNYISESIGHVATGSVNLRTVPWKSIMVSLPVWAITFANFGRSWSGFFLLANQLTYMNNFLHIDIRNSGLLSILPQVFLAVSVFFSGQTADRLISGGKLGTGNVRKLFNTFGFMAEALFFGILAFTDNPILAVVCLVLSNFFSGTCQAGFNVNHFDIAPRYASILMGFSNGFSALAGLSGYITQNLTIGNPAGWRTCFLIAMGIDLFCSLFYLLFAQGTVQDWAKEAEPVQPEDSEVLGTIVRKFSSRRSTRRSEGPAYERMEEPEVPSVSSEVSRNTEGRRNSKKKAADGPSFHRMQEPEEAV